MNSEICLDGTYWDRDEHKCLQCEGKYPKHAGYEFTQNCGWSDDQHQVDPVYRPCRDGTFNDGFHVKCQKCHTCTTPEFVACSGTSDTICCKRGAVVFNGSCVSRPLQTTVMTTLSMTSIITDSTTTTDSSSPTSARSPFQSNPHAINLTGIYVCLGILSALMLVCLIFVFKRRRTNQLNEEFHKLNGEAREILSKTAINRNENSTVSYNIISEIDNDHFTGSAVLLADVQNAPLKTVLNNLDVLEELVLVLDPDTTGAKNTRHLAAQCSFSFAWINYAYSMKDHKSPFVAVLEGVVTKNPDWTVGHLAELLTAIGRNDAVEILAKLPAGVEE